MTAEPLVRFDAVGMAFGGQPVLRDLSLGVRAGESLAIIGQSGCGKTVTLKLIVALLSPTTGRVLVEGRDLAGLPPADLVAMRRRFGFLFQGAALFDSLTVRDNVAYPLRALHRLGEAEVQTKVRERLREVGLPESAEAKMPSELSGGMRKRVGLARALALDPDVMLYDEPTTGLDPVMTETINDLILQTRHRRPVTSVIVTHEMKTVRRVADRVVMLHPLSQLEAGEPQIIFDGSPAELGASADDRVRRFLASGAA